MTSGDSERPVSHVVVTVHGIRTFGFWQERLQRLIHDKKSNVEVVNYKYGRFSAVAFMVPFVRWLVTLRFRKELLEIARQYPNARIDLVGHSFGTHLIGWGLLRIPLPSRPTIHTIILAGSVLKPAFPWARLMSQRSVHRLVNECGTADLVLVMNQVLVLFTGVAGILGFEGMTGERLRNNWYRFGHSGYFLMDGRESDDFMSERWIPLLTSEQRLEQVDRRPRGEAYSFWVFVLQNLALFKLASYAILVIVATVWIKGVRQTQRDEAARDLAAKSDTIRKERPNHLPESVLLAVQSVQQSVTPQGDLALRQGLTILPLLVANLHHGGSVTALTFNQDDSSLATVSENNMVQIWRVHRPAVIGAIKASAEVEALAFESKPAGLLFITQRGEVMLWTNSGEAKIAQLGTEAEKATICQAGKSPSFATAVHDFTVHMWHGKGRSELAEVAHDNRLMSLACSNDGHWLVSGGYDYSVLVSAFSRSPKLRKRLNNAHPVSAVAISPDGERIGFGDTFGGIRIWDLATDQEVSVGIERANWVTSLTFSPDGRWLASASTDASARVWDTETGQELARMVHDGPVLSVAFSNDGQRIATGSQDHTARIWDISQNLPIKQQGQLCALAFRADGQALAAGDTYGNLQVISLRSTRETNDLRTVRRQGAAIESVAFSNSGTKLIAALDDGNLIKFDLIRHGELKTLRLRGVSTATMALSANAKFVATATWNGDVRVFATENGDLLAAALHPKGALAVALSVDGRLVASGGSDRTARLWAWAHPGAVRKITHGDEVSAVAFSPDGKYLATGAGKLARVWALDGQRTRNVAELPSDETIELVAFSPESRYLAVTRGSNSVRIWEWAKRSPIAEFRFGGRVCCVAFSADGNRIALGSTDGSARVWPLLPSGSATEACRRLRSYLAGGAVSPSFSLGAYKMNCSTSGLM